MTREEALQILDTIPTIGEQVDALEMAIQALSQEPTDAISREAVIMECIKYADHEHNVRVKKEVSERRKHDAQVIIYACDYFKTFVEKLPSVTQKSGKWIKKEDDTCWWYACSECEQEPLKNRWNDDDVLSTFCPNCGAKMVEPQESEE